MIRTIAGGTALAAVLSTLALAEPEVYEIDKAHTNIVYELDHLGYSRSQGRFESFDGQLLIDDEDPSRSSVEVTIKTDSIDSFWADRTTHLKSADFFNVGEHPEMTFKSTSVAQVGEDKLEILGDLTILGTTRPVTLDVDLLRMAPHPMNGTPTVGFRATTRIKRSEFGMSAFVPAVSDEVDITIDLEAQKAS